MKICFTLLPMVAALSLAGCGQKDASATASAGSPAAGPREIDITANDTMHYDVTAIAAKPGEDLKVVLTNAGSNPITVMGHNWVLLKAGTDVASFASACAGSAGSGYIAPAVQDQIVAKIDLLGPHKSGEADFKAPTTPGDYPYLCTFPGHFSLMHGILTVK